MQSYRETRAPLVEENGVLRRKGRAFRESGALANCNCREPLGKVVCRGGATPRGVNSLPLISFDDCPLHCWAVPSFAGLL
jgi:hypothetical protein